MVRVVSWLVPLATSWFFTWAACAQETPSELREALASYERGDLSGAHEQLRSFERATSGRDLADLRAYYELEILVAFAQEEAGRMDEALRALGALDPDHAFSPRIPPEVIRRAAELRGAQAHAPLRVEAGLHSPAPGTVQVAPTVRGTAAYLVTRVVVSLRPLGSIDWQRVEGSSTVEFPVGTRLSYYAEALGPGGVVLATDGSALEPLTMELAPLAMGMEETGPLETGPLETGPLETGPLETGPLATGPLETRGEDQGTDTALLVALGVTAAALVVGAGVGIGYAVYANEPRAHRLGAGDVEFVVGMLQTF